MLSSFRELLGKATLHPAMLYYLDNYLNTVPRTQGGRPVGGINENHGRELLELHTVGVDAGYSQTDVVEASRCLTGHGIDNVGQSGNYVYRPATHDDGSKQVFGLSVASGGGASDIERLLDHLAAHPATARFVSKRLAQRFVADDPPEALVSRLAAVFLGTGGDLREVTKALFGSAEFWAEAFGTGKPKTGFEFVISAVRAAGGEVQNPRLVRIGDPGLGNAALRVQPADRLQQPRRRLAQPVGAALSHELRARPRRGRRGRRERRHPRPRPRRRRRPGEPARRRPRRSTASCSAARSRPRSLAAAGRVTTSSGVPVSARVAGLLFAGPEMQVR